LKAGKHLTEREAENIRRKGRLLIHMLLDHFHLCDSREGTCFAA
jgi:hypothetical protein